MPFEGGAGSGQHTKMCNQIVIAGTMIGVCESLLYGARAGLDLNTMLQSIRGGAAGCWTLENLAPRVLNGNFEPGFMVEHFIKDMGIALDEAARMKLALPGLAGLLKCMLGPVPAAWRRLLSPINCQERDITFVTERPSTPFLHLCPSLYCFISQFQTAHLLHNGQLEILRQGHQHLLHRRRLRGKFTERSAICASQNLLLTACLTGRSDVCYYRQTEPSHQSHCCGSKRASHCSMEV